MDNKMVASTEIKFYVHTNSNAPQLTNNFGCMIDVLDACLINGFGAQSVSTLRALGKVATVTFGAAHNFMQYQVIKITGTNQSEFNGEHRILSVPNANSFTFELENTATIAQATGTIICSLPPLGWEKPFSSTHSSGTGGKAAYRTTNLLLASRPFLRIVDELDPAYTATYAKYAKVGIVEDMTEIDTMVGVQAPFDIENPNKNWVGTGSGPSAINGWAKWYYACQQSFSHPNIFNETGGVLSGTRKWLLVGNRDYFYILPATTPTDTHPVIYGFGSFNSLINNDSSNNFLSASLLNLPANTSRYFAQYTPLSGTLDTQALVLQRGYLQNSFFSQGNNRSLRPDKSSATGTFTGSMDYIGGFALTNIAPFAPIFVVESVMRGEMHGIYWLFQKKPYLDMQLIERNGELYIATNCAPNNTEGQIIIKIGGL